MHALDISIQFNLAPCVTTAGGVCTGQMVVFYLKISFFLLLNKRGQKKVMFSDDQSTLYSDFLWAATHLNYLV